MVNPRRKALAFFLACMMLLSLLPMSAFAADADGASADGSAAAASEGINMDVEEGTDVGSRCPDFTFTTYDGKEYNLYDTLAEKDMVLINLWATWCGPCQSEFPAMTEAYEQYKDKIEIFALSVEPEDTNDVLESYVSSMGMTFPVGMDTPDLGTYFQVMYIPTTIVVDRNGIICFATSGAETNSVKFAALFDTFIGDDYAGPVILDGFPSVKPSVPAEDAAKLAATLGAGTGITVSNGEESDWPFITASADGRTYLQSTNVGIDESQAVLNATVTAKDGDVLTFDYNVSSEFGYDFLKIFVDGEAVKFYSGATGWDTFAYALDEGTHELSLAFVKDPYSGDGDDMACIDNLKVLSGTAAETALAAMPSYPHGDTTSVKLLNENGKGIIVNDDIGAIYANFGTSPDVSYITGSTTASFEFVLGEGVDPDSILIESTYSNSSTLLSECFVQESEDDPGKFIYETYVDTEDLTESSYTVMTVYYQQTGEQQYIYLFYDRQAVADFEEMFDEVYKEAYGDAVSVEEIPGKIDMTIPEGYELGQRIPNFTFTDLDGVEHDLYKTLGEKDMVLINIWATWCGPCAMEFPYMEESWQTHKDDIAIFALTCEPTDDVETLKKYIVDDAHTMTFLVGSDVAENGGPDLSTPFNVTGIPTSIVVDRFGRICFIEAGSQTSTAKFDQLFDNFIGDGYTESTVLNGIPGAKYTEARDDSAKLSAAVNAPGSKLEVKNSDLPTEWPFAAKDGYIESVNATPEDNTDEEWDTGNTTAVVTFDVEAKSGDVLAMEYKLQSEANCDLFVVYVDGKAVKTLSGDWGDEYRNLAIQLTAGKHEVKITYEKDPYTSAGCDSVCIKNLAVLSGVEGYNALRKNPVYPEAKENSVKLPSDAKALKIDDPVGDLAYFFEYYGLEPSGYYIVGDTLKLTITLAKGFNPESAAISSLSTGASWLVAPYLDGDHYTVEIPVDSLGTTGDPYTYLTLEATSDKGETFTYEVCVFADESNADLFCLSNTYDTANPVNWAYATTRSPADYGKGAPKAGDRAKNFTYTDTKGVAHTLNDMLKTKKAVVVLYGPMNANNVDAYTELQAIYEKYKDQVDVIAYNTNPLDKAEKLDKFATANKITYPVVAGDPKVLYEYGATYVPYYVVIDSEGTIVLTYAGAAPDVQVEALFAYLTDKDYKSGALADFPLSPSTIEAPEAADQLKALGAQSNVKIVKNTDKYEWPFVAATAEDGTTYLTSGNTGKDNTKAVLKTEITAKAGDVLVFDYKVDCEDGSSLYLYDYLTVELDGTVIATAYGEVDWTSFDWDLTAGKHTLTFTFYKDYMMASGDDMAGVRNLKVLTGDEAKAFVAARPVYPFADATTISVEGATKMIIDDPNGEIMNLFGFVPDFYVSTGSKVTFNMTLEEGKKPEHITVFDENSMEMYKLSDLVSEDGTCYTLTVEGKNLPNGFGGIEMIDELSGEDLAPITMIFPEESGISDFFAMYLGAEPTFTWTFEGGAPAPSEPDDREPAPEGYYVVRFVDEEGNPVEGVRVQACNGDLCTITYSDENGEFSVPVADDAHFSVATCPDGLTADSDDHLYEEGYVMIFVLENA